MTGDDDHSVRGKDRLIINRIPVLLTQNLAQPVVRFGENRHVRGMSKIAFQSDPIRVRASKQGDKAEDAPMPPGMRQNVGPELLLRPRTEVPASDKAGSHCLLLVGTRSRPAGSEWLRIGELGMDRESQLTACLRGWPCGLAATGGETVRTSERG